MSRTDHAAATPLISGDPPKLACRRQKENQPPGLVAWNSELIWSKWKNNEAGWTWDLLHCDNMQGNLINSRSPCWAASPSSSLNYWAANDLNVAAKRLQCCVNCAVLTLFLLRPQRQQSDSQHWEISVRWKLIGLIPRFISGLLKVHKYRI